MKERCTDSRYKNSHKKSAKIFAKAPCKALDIKPCIGQSSQLHSFTASQLRPYYAQIKTHLNTNFLTPYAQDRNTVLVRFFGMTDKNPAKASLSTYNFPLKKE